MTCFYESNQLVKSRKYSESIERYLVSLLLCTRAPIGVLNIYHNTTTKMSKALRINSVFCLVLIGILVLSSCANNKVTRLDESTQVDLSGRWNDTDSRMVSEEMVKDGLSRAWVTDFIEASGKKPTIIVGTVKNKTSEHISTEGFIADIEREFINSGKVKVVQGGQAREELRNERGDQQDYASPETVKRWGLERGADFILQGKVTSITDANSKEKVVSYQVDIEMSSLETNEKVWIGTKKIKKLIK